MALPRVPALRRGKPPASIDIPDGADGVPLQALGERDILVTPMALLEGYLRLARLRREGNPRYDPIWRGLRGAVEYGTGQLAQVGPVPVAGKTGTATKIEGPGRHAWFAGYAPAGKPRAVVLVFLEDGLGGSDAAPVAGSMFRSLFEKLEGR